MFFLDFVTYNMLLPDTVQNLSYHNINIWFPEKSVLDYVIF